MTDRLQEVLMLDPESGQHYERLKPQRAINMLFEKKRVFGRNKFYPGCPLAIYWVPSGDTILRVCDLSGANERQAGVGLREAMATWAWYKRVEKVTCLEKTGSTP